MTARPRSNPSTTSAAVMTLYATASVCLHHGHSGPSLPLSPPNEFDDPRSFLLLSLHVQFLPLLRERTASSFAIGCPLELSSLLLLSTAFVVAAVVVRSFRHCYLQLLPLLLSFAQLPQLS
ncbi:hypothetical protein GW17_00027399 [Ensete ventricosum]|nr:hypothetical protein GW17_00027399 [Ensete ventricosum]